MSFDPIAEGGRIRAKQFKYAPSFRVIDQGITQYYEYLKFTPMELKEIIPGRFIRGIDGTKIPKVMWNFMGRPKGTKTYATCRLML